MERNELIFKNYSESIKGIDENLILKETTGWYNYICKLPTQLKYTYLVVVFHNQIFNGGFHQYFVNGYGQFYIETVEALEKIGAKQRSSLLKTAFKFINPNNLPIVIFREKLLKKQIDLLFVGDELFKTLDALDKEYDNIVDEDIEELLGDFLKNRG